MWSLFNNPYGPLFIYGGFLTAITIHEFAHAWFSDRLGDPTARLLGRMTLNPLPHIDIIGTFLLPLFLLFSNSMMLFGWAKPVPVDPFNFKNPRKDSAIVSLVGPGANIITAIIISSILRIFPVLLLGTLSFIGDFLQYLIYINVILAVFNLVPVHPFDGFAVVEGILPDQYARQWHELSPYGMLFLLFLIFPLFGQAAPVTRIISPIINFLLSLLLPGTGII